MGKKIFFLAVGRGRGAAWGGVGGRGAAEAGTMAAGIARRAAGTELYRELLRCGTGPAEGDGEKSRRVRARGGLLRALRWFCVRRGVFCEGDAK